MPDVSVRVMSVGRKSHGASVLRCLMESATHLGERAFFTFRLLLTSLRSIFAVPLLRTAVYAV